MSDMEDRLREALERLVPDDLSAQDLSAGAWAYHARVRRRQVAAVAAVCAVVLAVAALAVSMPGRATRTLPAGPLITPGQCSIPPSASALAQASPEQVSVEAAWICPDAVARPGDGWTLPSDPLSGRYAAQVSALPYLTSDCRPLTGAPGPAFTFYRVEGIDRRVTQFRSRDSACAAPYLLATYLAALADQQADASAARLPLAQLPCRSDSAWTNEDLAAFDNSAGAQPIYARNAVPLAAATLCLKPLYLGSDGKAIVLNEPLAPRNYVAVPLDHTLLTLLNADLPAAREGFSGNGGCNLEGRWTYSIVARTQAGSYLKMSTGCLDELFILSAAEATSPGRYGFIPSAESTSALRALVAQH